MIDKRFVIEVCAKDNNCQGSLQLLNLHKKPGDLVSDLHDMQHFSIYNPILDY
jgi:hypothetical protein